MNEKKIISRSMFNGSSDLESDHEKPSSVSPTITFGRKTGPVSSLSKKKDIESKLIFAKRIETPVFDVYSSTTDIIFDKNDCYLHSEIDVPMNAKLNNPLKMKPSSSGASSYDDFMHYKEPEKHTHNSVVTIFAIWNTTMGSSLLAMSWGIHMAGLFPGIAVNILVAALCLYTCHLLLMVNEKHGLSGQDIDVSHLCRDLLGKWSEVVAKIFSVIVLLGADIVYMILMSNFLYNSVYFIYGLIVMPFDPVQNNVTVLCPKESLINSTTSSTISMPQSQFDNVWNLYSTVPVFLAVILFGVLNFKSPTFFAKFNSLGTISVVYLLIFVAVKAYGWGINISDWSSELYIKPTFSALSGMLSLSYFIHNIIISIMKNNKHQEHNGRDLSIAFGLVTFTYLFIGVLFYISFPLAKSCIEDNIFNNF
ncbi:sodium-coupled neutral amino acid transporter 9 homolog, partial [Anthonomus grandis grandis]|uniref:sodium-coupled neutral amino acid transporter 9 homolog n=1 Tax=Anthonomus grandis grandis TaxID=2921223 RepID=UPI0021668030